MQHPGQGCGVPARSHGRVNAQCNKRELCQVGPKDASWPIHSSRELVSGVRGAPFTDSVHRIPCLIVDVTIRHWICKFARLVPAHAVGFMSTTPTAIVLVQCKFHSTNLVIESEGRDVVLR